MTANNDSFGAKGTLEVGGEAYEIYRLGAVPGLEKLPYSLKVLAEALLESDPAAVVDVEVRRLVDFAHEDQMVHRTAEALGRRAGEAGETLTP